MQDILSTLINFQRTDILALMCMQFNFNRYDLYLTHHASQHHNLEVVGQDITYRIQHTNPSKKLFQVPQYNIYCV